MAKERRFHLARKVRWHRASGRWVVTIGRVLTKRGILADKDWYFAGTLAEEEANARANDRAQQWAVICRNWAQSEQPLLETFGEPFPGEPRWNKKVGGRGRELKPEEIRKLQDENGVSEDLIIQTMQEYTLRGFVDLYGESRNEEMRENTLRHTSWRKLLAQMKSAAAFFPKDVPAKDLKQVHFKEVRRKLFDNPYAPRTVRNYMAAILELVRYVYKEHMGDAAVPQGIVDACTVEKTTRTNIRLYGVEELKAFVTATKGTISQVDLLLAMNCAMYPQDIGRLRLDEIDLSDGSIFWDREKEPQNPFRLHHVLWPETLRLLKRYLTKGAGGGTVTLDFRRGPDKPEQLDARHLALLDRGKARYWTTPSGHEKDWVSKRMAATVEEVSFRDVRKSVNQVFLDTIEGEGTHDHTTFAQELSDYFLGHKTPALVRTYRTLGKKAYIRMNKHLKVLGDRLRAAGVFEHVPADGAE